MADQKINALPPKAAPATGDKLLLVGAAEESLIDYDALADAILNKLTSKTYTLDQGTKSFVAALNELNSKSYLLQGGTVIPSGADMNDYTTSGNYYCPYDSYAQSLTHAPFTRAFTMKVEYANGISYPRQIFTEYSTGIKAMRAAISTDGSWNSYVYFSDDATVLLATQNTTPPYMPFSSQSEADEYLNSYSQGFLIRTHYYLGVNFSFAHTPLGGGEKLIEGYKTSNNYEWQIAKQYTPTGIGIHGRSKVNGSWTEWKLLYNG